MIKTTNGGLTWDSISFNNYSNFRKIYKNINNELILGGYFGAFYKSNNNGLTWNSISNFITDNDLFNTIFSDNQKGILLGGGGFLAKTTNNGINWNQINVNVNNNFINGKFINSDKVILTGSNGLILRSSDSGNNWVNVSVSSNYNLSGIDFPKPNLGFIVGNYFQFGYHGILLKSTNEGMSWATALQSNNNLFCDIEFIDSVSGFITDQRGNLLRTTNGGNSWSTIAFGDGNYLSSIFFHNTLTGYIGNADGILKTTNGGNSWQSIPINISGEHFSVSSIDFTNISTGYLVGITYHSYYLKSGVIFKTINGGINWYHVSDNSTIPYLQHRGFNSIDFVNDSIGFICGDRGTLLKTSNGGFLPIGLQNVSYEILQKFSLFQNYPNPFNPQTKIKFAVPSSVKGQTSNVKLIIYDLLGREVTTLVNKELKPGTYEADWDGSNYSSGVYFYKIISGDFVETKKMVLMK
ncbi:MAG TPA: YCF48-related protein [Ignavibacteria bacterium]|nr:YCF48-related protein [Ignavibacteria bacterium]